MVTIKTCKIAGSQTFRPICGLDCQVIHWKVCAMLLKRAWLAYLNCSRISICPLEKYRQVSSDGLHEDPSCHTTLIPRNRVSSWNERIRQVALYARSVSHLPQSPGATPQFLKLGHRPTFPSLSSSLLLLNTLQRCLKGPLEWHGVGIALWWTEVKWAS